MKTAEIIDLINKIVSEATELKNRFTNEQKASVNYVCIFSQSDAEFEQLKLAVSSLGQLIKPTDSGPIFALKGIDTISGTFKVIKIRQPDPSRPERGDTDFTVSDYESFKKAYLPRSGFGLITRPNMEMIELMHPGYNVRVYFSHPPLIKVLGLE